MVWPSWSEIQLNPIERLLAKLSFRGSRKTRTIRQMQRLIKAGVPITVILNMLWNLNAKKGRKPKDPIALMIREWQRRLNQGKSLAASMHGWISTSEEMIIEAGELSDKLAKSLDGALHTDKATNAIKRAVTVGLAYPALLLLVMIGILWGFSKEIVPTFATILSPEKWTGNAAILHLVSGYVVKWLPLVGVLMLGIGFLVVISLPNLTGAARRYLDYLPPWSIYKTIQGASFMIAMGGFISAGASVPESLRRMAGIGTPYLRERVSAILARVNMGRNLGQAMIETGYEFPENEIAGEISIYAELDGFDESIDLLAREWVESTIENVKAALKILNNLMLFAIVLSIAGIATAMFELQELLASTVQ